MIRGVRLCADRLRRMRNQLCCAVFGVLFAWAKGPPPVSLSALSLCFAFAPRPARSSLGHTHTAVRGPFDARRDSACQAQQAKEATRERKPDRDAAGHGGGTDGGGRRAVGMRLASLFPLLSLPVLPSPLLLCLCVCLCVCLCLCRLPLCRRLPVRGALRCVVGGGVRVRRRRLLSYRKGIFVFVAAVTVGGRQSAADGRATPNGRRTRPAGGRDETGRDGTGRDGTGRDGTGGGERCGACTGAAIGHPLTPRSLCLALLSSALQLRLWPLLPPPACPRGRCFLVSLSVSVAPSPPTHRER
jgi:hypothetical protein